MANVTSTARISADKDIEGIVLSAGGGVDGYTWHKGTLSVFGPSQASLDAAIAAYDHSAFLARRNRERILEQLSRSDTKMARVAEDIVSALVSRGIITLADIPARARDAITERTDLRQSLGS